MTSPYVYLGFPLLMRSLLGVQILLERMLF